MLFTDPKANLLQIGIRDGMRIADLGTGSGHYALYAAAAVGSGKVYAVDIQEDVLTRLKNEAAHRNIRNLETVWGNIEHKGGTKLKDAALHAAVLSNVLFQLERAEDALAEVKRILMPGGKVLVTDWAGSYGGFGPAEEHIVPEHEAEKLLIDSGFHKLKAFRAGPHHYSMLFAAP